MKTLVSIVAVVSISSIATGSYAESGAGRRLAKEAIALVSYAEMSNIASTSPECAGTSFQTFDINELVEKVIAPEIDRVAMASGERVSNEKRSEVLVTLKGIPNNPNTVHGIQTGYQTLLRNAVSSHGESGACIAASSIIQTIVHQKWMAIRDVR